MELIGFVPKGWQHNTLKIKSCKDCRVLIRPLKVGKRGQENGVKTGSDPLFSYKLWCNSQLFLRPSWLCNSSVQIILFYHIAHPIITTKRSTLVDRLSNSEMGTGTIFWQNV
jgi:hypothetical protein